jgi:predicted DNA-binding transcriptional regulator AlpA
VLSIDDVAEHFDVSTRTIWRWVAVGVFPAPLRIGRRMRYWDAGEIDSWLGAGCPKVSDGDDVQD